MRTCTLQWVLLSVKHTNFLTFIKLKTWFLPNNICVGGYSLYANTDMYVCSRGKCEKSLSVRLFNATKNQFAWIKPIYTMDRYLQNTTGKHINNMRIIDVWRFPQSIPTLCSLQAIEICQRLIVTRSTCCTKHTYITKDDANFSTQVKSAHVY